MRRRNPASPQLSFFQPRNLLQRDNSPPTLTAKKARPKVKPLASVSLFGRRAIQTVARPTESPALAPNQTSSVGRLTRAISALESLPASDWVLSVLRWGYKLRWMDSKPLLTTTPPPARMPASRDRALVIQQEIESLLQKGVIEPVMNPSSLGFYSHLFTVPKASGGWRPVLDLSALNTFLRPFPFRMETVTSVRASIRQGDWATSIDLSEAYFHIPICPSDQKWLRFTWEQQIFQLLPSPLDFPRPLSFSLWL